MVISRGLLDDHSVATSVIVLTSAYNTSIVINDTNVVCLLPLRVDCALTVRIKSLTSNFICSNNTAENYNEELQMYFYSFFAYVLAVITWTRTIAKASIMNMHTNLL